MKPAQVYREVTLVRRTGSSGPTCQRWSCHIDHGPDGLSVRVGGSCGSRSPGGQRDSELRQASAALHNALLRDLPLPLGSSTRAEVGAVWTHSTADSRPAQWHETWYTLVTCADVVVGLEARLSQAAMVPWHGTCAVADIDPALPVALSPSAVLSLTAASLELSGTVCAVPHWLTVQATHRSPYPPHDCPAGLTNDGTSAPDTDLAAIAWLAGHPGYGMRPMRTARASRGQYQISVSAVLPPAPSMDHALLIESLVSLDTRGLCWKASLSCQRPNGRLWVVQPLVIEISGADLLSAAVGHGGPPSPALDRDPVDGEAFGWAPALLTSLMAGDLAIRRP